MTDTRHSPCYRNKCKNRTPTCHATCFAYEIWQICDAVKKEHAKKHAEGKVYIETQ